MTKEVTKLKFEPGDQLICTDPVLMGNTGEVIIPEGHLCECSANTHFPDGSSYISVWMGTKLGTVFTTDSHFELYNPVELEGE